MPNLDPTAASSECVSVCQLRGKVEEASLEAEAPSGLEKQPDVALVVAEREGAQAFAMVPVHNPQPLSGHCQAARPHDTACPPPLATDAAPHGM